MRPSFLRLLAPSLTAALLAGCAVAPPAPPPPPPAPVAQFIIPEGTEFVSELFGYSQAVRVGPWVTTSAIPGFDIEKRGFPASYTEQVAAGFANLKRVLEASGARMEDVVEIVTYQLDTENQFNDTIDGKNEAFGLHKPTWTPVGVKSLPLPSMLFQVSARAYSPGGKAPTPAGAAGVDPATVPPPSPVPVEAPGPEDVEPAPAARKKDTPSPRFMNRPGY